MSSKRVPQHITIEIMRHRNQRYDTAGDYQAISKHCWYLAISKMSDWRYSALVLIHEIVEMFLTVHHGIKWEDIDAFDMAHPELADPGNDPRAPYHKEHMAATKIEKLCALLLGVIWSEYDAAFDKLKWRGKHDSGKT